jgi:DNA transformation protein and related proteins
MATTKEFAQYIVGIMGVEHFSVKPMFSEYCIYCDGKVVGFICDNRLLIKPMAQSKILEGQCEMDQAYPESKLYYVIDESKIDDLDLREICFAMAAAIPEKKKKPPKSSG